MIRMLPVEIGAYISVLWEEAQYSIYVELKIFILKYIKTSQNLKRATTVRAAHLVEEQPPADAEATVEDDEHAELLERLVSTDDVHEQVDPRCNEASWLQASLPWSGWSMWRRSSSHTW